MGRRVNVETAPLEVSGPPTVKRVPDPNVWVGEQVTQEVGEPSRKTAVTRRVYTEDGKKLYDTTWSSFYRAEPTIVRYGTKPRPKAPPPPPEEKPKKNPPPPPPPPADPTELPPPPQ